MWSKCVIQEENVDIVVKRKFLLIKSQNVH